MNHAHNSSTNGNQPGLRLGSVLFGLALLAVSAPATAAPGISLSRSSIGYAAVAITGASATKSFTLTNNGDATLNIATIVAAGDFVQNNNCGASLNPTMSCTINVGFNPTGPGSRSGAVSVSSNASGSPHQVTLSGTGDLLLDPTFGSGGKVVTAIGSGGDYANAVVVQSNGQILVTGYSNNGAGYNKFALARFNADGTRDTVFGTVITSFAATSQDYPQAITLQADGKIVVAGYSNANGNNDIAVVRYNTDGTLDSSFGSGGKLLTNFSGSSNDVAAAVFIQPDGKIVVGGYSTAGDSYDFALVRYNTEGTLDTNFGAGGKVLTPFGSATDDRIYALALQTDGRIVAAGYGSLNLVNNDFALARYNTDGSLDGGFGDNGRVTIAFGGEQDSARGLAIQPDGKIVVGGYSNGGPYYALWSYIAVARLSPNGMPDGSFGAGGKVTTNIAGRDYARAIALQADGKIVVGGSSDVNGHFMVARYNPDGVLDTTFGAQITSVGVNRDDASALAIQNGKIVLAGYSTNDDNNKANFALVRYALTTPADTTAPTVPAGLTATAASPTQITISWTASTDATGVVGYKLYRAGSAVPLANLTVATYSDSGLIPATTYGYTVAACDAAGNCSAKSAVAFATTSASPDTQAPNLPTGLTAIVIGSGQISLAWNAASDNIGVTAYKVYRNAALVTTVTSPSHSDLGLIPGATYSYTVAACDASGNCSGLSSAAVATTATAAAPVVSLSATSLAFANVAVAGTSRPQTITLTNTGNAPLVIGAIATNGDFAQTNNCSSTLNVGTACTIQVRFGPSAAGTLGGKLTVGSNAAGSPHQVSLGGMGDLRLDPLFGSGGKQWSAMGAGSDTGRAITDYPDGRIVVAGNADRGGYNSFALARYSANGSYDESFGDVLTNFGPTSQDYANAVVVQGDGKVVAGGYSNASGNNDFALARYGTDGKFDLTFGVGGKVLTAFATSKNDIANATLVQADGKILQGGYSNAGDNYDFALVRYNTDGSLDNDFGTGGKVLMSFGAGSEDYINAMALQPDGKIVAVGYTNAVSGLDFAVARFNTDGSLDTSFGNGGKVTTAFNELDYAQAVKLQADGKIVVAGYTNWCQASYCNESDFAVVRYNTNGTLDGTFGNGGKTTIGVLRWDYAYAVTVQTDGKIVIGGHSSSDGNNYNFMLARLNADGTNDASYGPTLTDLGGNQDHIAALLLQADGKIVAVGDSVSANGTYDFALARYVPTASVDTTPPSVPAGLTATAISSTQVNLSWTASSGTTGVAGYKVYRAGGTTPIGAPSGTLFSDYGLAASATYSYFVVACNSNGNCSAPSATASATTLAVADITPPSIPIGLTAVAINASQVTLGWTPSTDNVAVTHYKVFRNGSTTPVATPSASIFGDTGLTGSTLYRYTVAACDAAGNCSAATEAASATTPSAPSPAATLSLANLGFGAVAVGSTSTARAVTLTNTGSLTLSGISVAAYGDFAETNTCGGSLGIGASCTVSVTFTPTVGGARIGSMVISSNAAGSPNLVSLSGSGSAYAPALIDGWNLIGNSLATPIDVAATFGSLSSPVAGVSANILSIWKWNATAGRWAFYSPQLNNGTGAGTNSAYATAQGFDLFTTINPKEGYWVNVISSSGLAMPLQSGAPASFTTFDYQALKPTWNLIAIADVLSPADFNLRVNSTPPNTSGSIPINAVSVWAWDAAMARWYFYSPQLEATGGLAEVKSYANSRGFLHFEDFGKKLEVGVGFWVNVPSAAP